MTEINKSSEQSLNAILNKLGVKTQDEAQKQGNKNSLGQEDFKINDHPASKSRSICTHGQWGFYSTNGTIFNCHRYN